jgi:hypothetical protein
MAQERGIKQTICFILFIFYTFVPHSKKSSRAPSPFHTIGVSKLIIYVENIKK